VDNRQPSLALGMFVLALLMGVSATPTVLHEAANSDEVEPLSLAQIEAPLATRIALGERVPSNCSDIDAWRAIPGVGPTLGRRLAQRASLGLLRQQEDLLPVRGVGAKMAGEIGRWIRWQAPPSSRTRTQTSQSTLGKASQ